MIFKVPALREEIGDALMKRSKRERERERNTGRKKW